MSTTTIKRDDWGALMAATEADCIQLNDIIRELREGRADEHGGWEFGITSDRKKRGTAINLDYYAFGTDIHSGQFLAVVQVRRCQFRPGWYSRIHKAYYLIGRNEDGSAFAHPVSANVVHRAIRDERDIIQSCQDWMFGGDYTRLVRQGDLAMLPVSRAVGERIPERVRVLAGSHRVKARSLRVQGGAVYARDPIITHIPGTHATIAGDGWWRVVIGKRGRAYSFALAVGD